jgi:hypothetical protein
MTDVDTQRSGQDEPDLDHDEAAVPASAVRPDVTSGEYIRGYLSRLRAGETGLLPVIVG